MIKIGLVEDNHSTLKALEEKLSFYEDLQIVFTAKDGKEAIELLSKNPNTDILLMDIEMPIMTGIQATAHIKHSSTAIKIVMITIFDDDKSIFQAIQAGADSYILKETKAAKIYETIIDTINGGAVMSPSIAMKALQLLKISPEPPDKNVVNSEIHLSDRETEILEQLSRGLTNKKIGDLLFISPFTVKRHIENIYQKLHAHNRIEAIENARKNKLI